VTRFSRTLVLRFALGLSLLALSFHAPQHLFAQPAAKPGSDEASERFRAGVAFYKTGDFPAALVEFKRAYELAPNYRVLYNLGQTSQELNFYADALMAFEQYLLEGGKEVDAVKKAKVQTWINDLKKKVGTITVETNAEGAEIVVDDVLAGVAPLEKPIIVNAGRRKFSASAKGYLPLTRVLEVAGSDEKTLKLDLTPIEQAAPDRPRDVPVPPPPRERTIPTAAWVMLGATGAAGVVTGVMGGLALSARSDLDDALDAFPGDTAAIQDAQNRTQTFAITTDVFIGITAAAAVTTIVLFAVDFGHSEPASDATKEPTPEARLRVTPGGLSFSGSF